MTEYNATEIHTGVMGMYFLFISSDKEVTSAEASLEVPECWDDVCDVSLLPAPVDAAALAAPACFDRLAESPACTFGGSCSCEEFVSQAGSAGCGGVFSSEMGDIEVNSVCAKHCDACPRTCEDELPNSPVYRFGNLCNCEDFVNSPESTGCGGIYTSDMGDIEVNSMCASHCDACPDAASAEVIQKEIMEKLENQLNSACKYAKADCQKMLTNLYTCSKGYAKRVGIIDSNVDAVVKKHDESLALKHTKLGSPSLWRNMEATVIAPCEGVVLVEEIGSPAVESPIFNSQVGSSFNTATLFIAILVGVAVVGFGFLTVKKIQNKKRAQLGEISKAVVVQAGTQHSNSDESPSGSSSGSDSGV